MMTPHYMRNGVRWAFSDKHSVSLQPTFSGFQDDPTSLVTVEMATITQADII
nr:hypothetical protein [Sphingomonas sp. CDS-1]